MRTDDLLEPSEMLEEPICDWCDDDTGAIVGLPYTIANAVDGERPDPDRELNLCASHLRLAVDGLEAALEAYIDFKYR